MIIETNTTDKETQTYVDYLKKKKNKKFQWFASQKKYWQNLKHM